MMEKRELEIIEGLLPKVPGGWVMLPASTYHRLVLAQDPAAPGADRSYPFDRLAYVAKDLAEVYQRTQEKQP